MIKVLCESGKQDIAASLKYILDQLNGETEMLHWRIDRLNKEKMEMREEINLLHKIEEKCKLREEELTRENNQELEEMKMNLDWKEYLL